MTSEQLDKIRDAVEKLSDDTRESIEPLRRVYTDHIDKLEAENAQLRHKLYGRRSERMPTVADELRRKGAQPEQTVDGTPMPEDEERRAHERRRHARKNSETRRRENRETREALPAENIEVRVREDQLPEGLTREDFRTIGGEPTVVERIEWVPGRFVRLRYHLEAVVSKDGEHVVRAEPPPGVAPGLQYGPGLHAHVVTSKCADSQPLHRKPLTDRPRGRGAELMHTRGDVPRRAATCRLGRPRWRPAGRRPMHQGRARGCGEGASPPRSS